MQRKLIDLLHDLGLVESRNQARRVVHQRAVFIDGIRALDPDDSIDCSIPRSVRVGRTRFATTDGLCSE